MLKYSWMFRCIQLFLVRLKENLTAGTLEDQDQEDQEDEDQEKDQN